MKVFDKDGNVIVEMNRPQIIHARMGTAVSVGGMAENALHGCGQGGFQCQFILRLSEELTMSGLKSLFLLFLVLQLLYEFFQPDY